MPKRTDIHSILIIGAGPIVIGQACEFDYSGTQACKALKAEGYRIVLVNSNPATIMTDPDLADATYIEPITPEIVAKIIEKGAAGCAAADHGRTDSAQHGAVARQDGRPGQIRREDDRRHRRCHRQGGGSQAVPRSDGRRSASKRRARSQVKTLDPGARGAGGNRRFPQSYGHPSPWAAPAAASPTTGRSSSTSSSAASMPRPPPRC